MQPVTAPLVTREYTQKIEADPDAVFPLLCPVREREWLEGWAGSCQVVHTRSGVAEAGCVFITRGPGVPDTVWAITRHDPHEKRVEFHRVTSGLVATRLAITVAPTGAGRSEVHIAYTLTPLCPEGEAFARDAFAEEAFVASMRWWERSMNHWLRTGTMLTHAHAA